MNKDTVRNSSNKKLFHFWTVKKGINRIRRHKYIAEVTDCMFTRSLPQSPSVRIYLYLLTQLSGKGKLTIKLAIKRPRTIQ